MSSEQVNPTLVRRAWREAPVSMFGATVAGIGHLPGGPGTYAAAVMTPAIVWMSAWALPVRLACLAAALVVGVIWSGRAGRALGEEDSRRVVLDEVLGVWTTLVWFGELGWAAAFVGFVAFRILDVVKPPGARWIHHRGGAGWSVVGDDVVAGLWAVPAVLVVQLLIG